MLRVLIESGYRTGLPLVSPNPGASAPWSIRILGEPGYEVLGVFVTDQNNLSEEDKRLKQKLQALFPEARVVLEQLPIPPPGYRFKPWDYSQP